jgi:hypothetical protein
VYVQLVEVKDLLTHIISGSTESVLSAYSVSALLLLMTIGHPELWHGGDM